MTEPAFVEHDSAGAMAAALAGTMTLALADAVDARGHASLAVSGGSTPVPLYERLAAADLPWQAVTVTLADERWVVPAHKASNEGLIRRTLLVERARAARFVPLKSEAETPEAGAREAARRLQDVPRPFNLVLLGMGGDGHTASLFPRAPELERALSAPEDERCVAIRPDPLPREAPFARMTLTAPALLDARRILLMIAGEKKRAAYERALQGEDARLMPVRAIVKQNRVPVEVHWAP